MKQLLKEKKQTLKISEQYNMKFDLSKVKYL